MITETLYRKYYFSRAGYVGGTIPFHNMITAEVTPGARILEIGPATTNLTTKLLSEIGSVLGLDLSDEAANNRYLSEYHKFDGGIFPMEDQSIDFCVSDWVLEHICDPVLHFREVARVLRPQGKYLFRTPNVWHYSYAFSWANPHFVHKLVSNRLRGLPEDAHEPYPTYYRANTLGRLRALAHDCGFQVHLGTIEPEPGYGHILPLFFPMLWYERIVNSTPVLQPMRALLLACFSKA